MNRITQFKKPVLMLTNRRHGKKWDLGILNGKEHFLSDKVEEHCESSFLEDHS